MSDEAISGGIRLTVDSSGGDTKIIYLAICHPRPVYETRELLPGVLFADFDDQGRLLGIEILGPL